MRLTPIHRVGMTRVSRPAGLASVNSFFFLSSQDEGGQLKRPRITGQRDAARGPGEEDGDVVDNRHLRVLGPVLPRSGEDFGIAKEVRRLGGRQSQPDRKGSPAES